MDTKTACKTTHGTIALWRLFYFLQEYPTMLQQQQYEPNDVIDISVSCCSEVRMIKKVFSTDYKNPALAENLEKQYRSYKKAEKHLRHR